MNPTSTSGSGTRSLAEVKATNQSREPRRASAPGNQRMMRRPPTRHQVTLRHGEIWHGHFANKRKDGTLYEDEATISPVRDAAGKIVNYVAVKRDVTREVQLEAQFRQAQKMESFGQLAGGVAHDFNNILAVIQLQAGLLKAEAGLRPAQLELAREIEKADERAAGLTRQLLLFSRKQTMQPRNLELKEILQNMTKMLERTLGAQFPIPDPIQVGEGTADHPGRSGDDGPGAA